MRQKNYRFTLVVAIMLLLPSLSIKAQNVAIKTNLLYDATATFNGGVEFAMGKKWTMDLSANYNPFTFSDNKKWKHWMVQPEARYWLCEKWNGHFFGVHAHGGQFNVGNLDSSFKFLGIDFEKFKDHRYEGWFIGGGVSYGYSWILSRHWNFEAEIGIGYAHFDFDKYKCEKCGEKLSEDKKNYVGPTKAALNLVYIF